jgi:hypothetical protein
MEKIDYLTWRPSSREDSEAWLSHNNQTARHYIAMSEFTDERTIKEMASHQWRWGNEGEFNFLPHLLDNPNLTANLQIWLDEETRNWGSRAQHAYWVKRYGIKAKFTFEAGEEKFSIRSFTPSLLEKRLPPEESCQAILEISDHFTEQMWHDLATQNQLELRYENSYVETFLPSELFNSTEEILNLFSPGFRVAWVRKLQQLDVAKAQSEVQGNGEWHFTESIFEDFLDEDSFPEENLCHAIGAGLENRDLKILDDEIFEEYLDAYYPFEEGTKHMYLVDLAIRAESPWAGERYSELTEEHQRNLVHNFINTLKHPYLGRADGISLHLMHCMYRHSQTAEAVKKILRPYLSVLD